MNRRNKARRGLRAARAAEEKQRLLELVRRSIRASGFTRAEVERRIGMQPSYLGQVFAGRLELKLKYLLRILAAIGVDPGAFFNLLFPEPGSVEEKTLALVRMLRADEREELRGEPGAEELFAEDEEEELSPAELEERLRRTVLEIVRLRVLGESLDGPEAVPAGTEPSAGEEPPE